MLGVAFAQGRGDLLAAAMTDRLHQPYRAEICPLLSLLLPLSGKLGTYGVALSGAGPSVLLIVSREEKAEVIQQVGELMLKQEAVEILELSFECRGTEVLNC